MSNIELNKCGLCKSLHTVVDMGYNRKLVKCVDCGAVIFIGDNRSKNWISRIAFEVLLNSKCVWSEV